MSSTDNRSSIRRKLGRGLGSLISTPVAVELPSVQKPTTTPPRPASPPAAGPTFGPVDREGLQNIDVQAIIPSRHQPRQHFDEGLLQALAKSIRTSGVMQPIVVRPNSADGIAGSGFELIAGERRWRAAQLAGLSRIPAIVRDVDDRTAAEFSLVENLQREDLNPLERAEAFERLAREFQLTHAEIAERVSLDRTSITNHLRLLELDSATKAAVRDGRLSMGHARALLAITNIECRGVLAAESLRQEWSVRELERQARAAADHTAANKPKVSLDGGERSRLPTPLSAHLADLQKRLSEHLGTKVFVHPGRNKGSGKLVIDFFSIDQFEGLLRRMGFETEE